MENLHWQTSLGGETVSEQRVSNCDGIHQSTASALEQLPTAVIRECLRVGELPFLQPSFGTQSHRGTLPFLASYPRASQPAFLRGTVTSFSSVLCDTSVLTQMTLSVAMAQYLKSDMTASHLVRVSFLLWASVSQRKHGQPVLQEGYGDGRPEAL